MKEKLWLVKSKEKVNTDELCTRLNILPVTAKLLINRGYGTPELAGEFLNKTVGSLCDPMLMPDMKKAVSRIEKAIKTGELITVYGDYDVDGITATAVLYDYLVSRGGHAAYYIPDRVEEGYGVNLAAIEAIAAGGGTLMITVDSGITAVEETQAAKSLGIDVIITDHHECAECLPEAAAVLDPKRPDSKYPFKSLAGVGVVFKLICALEGNDRLSDMINRYSELVALGTTADVMPLSGENRILVSLGLSRLQNTKIPGLKALMAAAGMVGKRITTSLIGYSLAPRINAIGRMGRAVRAVDLLLCKTAEEARQVALELCEANALRQEEENKLIADAFRLIEEDKSVLEDKIIILTGESWHNGVIGIAASRINERYGLPAVLITIDGDMGKGSCRSSRSPFNIYAALEQVKDCFEKFGGHVSAAGFSIKKEAIPEFKKKLVEYVRLTATEEELTPKVDIDCELSPEDICFETIYDIGKLEPFGTENPNPVFLLSDIQIISATPLSGDRHVRLSFKKDGRELSAFYFGMPASELGFYPGDRVDIAFNLDINRYRGEESPQITIRDMRLTAAEKERRAYCESLIKIYEEGGEFPAGSIENILPSMEDFQAVFRCVRSSARWALTDLCRAASERLGGMMNLCKLRVCIDVFEEMGILLVGRPQKDEKIYSLEIIQVDKKRDLNRSAILIRLRESRKERKNG